MNAKCLFFLVLAGLGGVSVFAQDVIVTAGVVANPTVIQSSAGYPAPAACQTRRACARPVAYAAPVVYSAPVAVYGYTPNVVYFGGPYSQLRNYYAGHAVGCYPYSRVVCFGRNEAYERGYYFNRWR